MWFAFKMQDVTRQIWRGNDGFIEHSCKGKRIHDIQRELFACTHAANVRIWHNLGLSHAERREDHSGSHEGGIEKECPIAHEA